MFYIIFYIFVVGWLTLIFGGNQNCAAEPTTADCPGLIFLAARKVKILIREINKNWNEIILTQLQYIHEKKARIEKKRTQTN